MKRRLAALLATLALGAAVPALAASECGMRISGAEIESAATG